MNKINGDRLKVKGVFPILCSLCFILLAACSPDAIWETENVEVTLRVEATSVGFVTCEFTTSKEAYYLIAIEEAREGYNPMEHQKSFMNAALDSAYAAYLLWRNDLWQKDVFNVAPFSSHSLQYGNEYYTFTGLKPDTKYWIYTFVVNPVAMEPAGRLVLDSIETSLYSDLEMQFEYRVKGYWDYTYPMDDYGIIENTFPYIAITCDSMEVENAHQTPEQYFREWFDNLYAHPDSANIIYGVKAVNNNGNNSRLEFEEGHTYYTTIASFDGPFSHMITYKFTWAKDYQAYFREEDTFIEY